MNKENYETFWYFINERHKIYERRIKGHSKPWSEDAIFQNWKFCNVFRPLDKQSKWLIENIIIPHWNSEPELLLFNIFAFRAFNWYPTYQWLSAGFTGKNWIDNWDEEQAQGSMDIYLDEFDGRFSSGAYMLRGREGYPKHESIIQTLDEIWETKRSLIGQILLNPTIKNTVQKIVGSRYWGWGNFTSYQVALDFTYSPILTSPEDLNTWCEFGPGAKRGIKLIYPEVKFYEMLPSAVGLLRDSPKHLGKHVPALTLQDIEFCLCELGKYVRIREGGKGKGRFNGT